MEAVVASFSMSAMGGPVGLGLFAASMGLKVLGGIAAASEQRGQAELHEILGERELLRGEQEQLEIKRGLNDVLSQNIVASFASGIKVGGSPAAGMEEAARRADFELDISRSNASFKSEMFRRSSGALKQSAISSIVGGVAGGIMTGFQTVAAAKGIGMLPPTSRIVRPLQTAGGISHR